MLHACLRITTRRTAVQTLRAAPVCIYMPPRARCCADVPHAHRRRAAVRRLGSYCCRTPVPHQQRLAHLPWRAAAGCLTPLLRALPGALHHRLTATTCCGSARWRYRCSRAYATAGACCVHACLLPLLRPACRTYTRQPRSLPAPAVLCLTPAAHLNAAAFTFTLPRRRRREEEKEEEKEEK